MKHEYYWKYLCILQWLDDYLKNIFEIRICVIIIFKDRLCLFLEDGGTIRVPESTESRDMFRLGNTQHVLASGGRLYYREISWVEVMSLLFGKETEMAVQGALESSSKDDVSNWLVAPEYGILEENLGGNKRLCMFNELLIKLTLLCLFLSIPRI